MHRFIKIFFINLLLLTPVFTSISLADDGVSPVTRKMVSVGPLPNVPGHNLTAVKIDLAPGVSVPSHQHEAFVFVYVLAGTVRSSLDDEEPVGYSVGESWVEPPGAVHSLTENLSDTEPAQILAVFIAEEGATLTTSGKIDD